MGIFSFFSRLFDGRDKRVGAVFEDCGIRLPDGRVGDLISDRSFYEDLGEAT